jgi:hypothetical protein
MTLSPIACEPDPSGMKFVAPPDERSRYERRADLIREVERQVHHDLNRLRQLGWSICGIARYTGLEPGTVTVLLNEPQVFPEPDRRRRKKKARPGQPAPGSRHSATKPLKPEIAMKGDMAEIS